MDSKQKVLYTGHRNSYTELNEPYFWTITIKEWLPILKDDFKNVIINCLKWLKDKELIRIYGYVIMPNHIHLLWEQLKMNGKEFPKNSFEKFTAHQFKILLKSDPGMLERFKVNSSDRHYNFWQRDPLAILIYNKEMLLQKLDYIHNNPVQPHWNLSFTPEKYTFSSAEFYDSGVDRFEILSHYNDYF